MGDLTRNASTIVVLGSAAGGGCPQWIVAARSAYVGK
jgi:hypothetical protein